MIFSSFPCAFFFDKVQNFYALEHRALFIPQVFLFIVCPSSSGLFVFDRGMFSLLTMLCANNSCSFLSFRWRPFVCNLQSRISDLYKSVSPPLIKEDIPPPGIPLWEVSVSGVDEYFKNVNLIILGSLHNGFCCPDREYFLVALELYF